MAKVNPFKGLQYNLGKIGNISKAVTLPYDVISNQQIEKFYKLSEFNIINLILPKGNRYKYKNAANILNRWISKKVLVRDVKPYIYVVKEEFKFNGIKKERISFICLVKLESFNKGSILPHEGTRSSPKKDRFELLKECRANLCPIFGLYIDPQKKIKRVLEKNINSLDSNTDFSVNEPSFNNEKTTVHHKMWKIKDKNIIKTVVEAMKNKKIVIADGHHRYEAALRFKNRYGYVMMQLFNMNDDGIIILPTHRLVKGLDEKSKDSLENKIQKNFLIKKSDRNKIFKEMKTYAKKRKCFGVYNREKGFRLLLSYDKTNELDVNILHCTLLDEVDVSYTIDADEAVLKVKNKEYDYVFFLNPTRVEEVEKIAKKGERMPGKSTYFFPKLITGLVINKFE